MYCHIVSTLPIRNGNSKCASALAPSNFTCKYLTYKEWKQLILVGFNLQFCSMTTLPIRNGNTLAGTDVVSTAAFCDYLTYKEWKPYSISSNLRNIKNVSTLTIRNGNKNGFSLS